ncbi:MAG: glycosyltransferase [Cyanothece sp. SIO1E1]|nr:glycosyltransferase [Cyanothece sp. SIO1E1]
MFGSVLHDPIRDTELGPTWWHRYSVRKAYDFIDLIFLHQALRSTDVDVPNNLPKYVIPHGPYPVDSAPLDKTSARKKLNLPGNKLILLSFGHIRDNKNLDLAIQCLKEHPELHLVVAGQSLGEAQRQPDEYRELATNSGVSDQISWFTHYIPDEEISHYFSASDGVLLTYSAGFRSASGVLNLAAAFDKPCIASSGPSPLEEQVKKYKLGVWVSPDSLGSLTEGMSVFKQLDLKPDWQGYLEDNSWERNASITKEAFLSYGGGG